MRTLVLSLVPFLFAGLASAQPTQPQEPAAQQAPAKVENHKHGKGACKADVEKFCKDVEKGKIHECLDQHKDELSDACKANREKKMESAKGMRHEACKDDVEKFCKDMEKGKIGECLKQHKDELSDACKAARTKKHEHKGKKAEQKPAEEKPAGQK